MLLLQPKGTERAEVPHAWRLVFVDAKGDVEGCESCLSCLDDEVESLRVETEAFLAFLASHQRGMGEDELQMSADFVVLDGENLLQMDEPVQLCLDSQLGP